MNKSWKIDDIFVVFRHPRRIDVRGEKIIPRSQSLFVLLVSFATFYKYINKLFYDNALTVTLS